MLTDEQLPALWESLGIPGIIDVHTHFLPEPVMSKVWEYFDNAGRNYGIEWPITYRWQDDERLAHLRAMGVEKFTSLVYAHKPGMAAWLNDWSLDFAANVDGCIPTATFFPEPDVVDYVARALDGGARVFKVHLQVGGFDPRDPALSGVWSLLADAGTPIVTHCGSAPLPGPFTGPGPIGEVLREFPDLRMIVAHLGADEFEQFLDLVDGRPATWLDTTMGLTDFMQSLRPFPQSRLPQLRELSARGNVLFGSDFPNIPYPFAHQVEVLADNGLDMPQVLWHAPARLFDQAGGFA